MFPAMLVERLVRCFTRDESATVLDPFAGSGSTLAAAAGIGRAAVGFEVCPQYAALARERLAALNGAAWALHERSARDIAATLAPESVDLCVTSPPYWNILAQRRSADGKEIRNYAPAEDDLSRIDDYEAFLEALGEVFDGVFHVLKPGGYCVVNVMDLRKQSQFFPFHSDLATRLTDRDRGGRFILDDLIIWDRRADYNNLRPLGFPYVFRVNKVHEFLIILRRPRGVSSP
jgi:DNA modification methylase